MVVVYKFSLTVAYSAFSNSVLYLFKAFATLVPSLTFEVSISFLFVETVSIFRVVTSDISFVLVSLALISAFLYSSTVCCKYVLNVLKFFYHY